MRRFALLSIGFIACALCLTQDYAAAQIVTGYTWIDPGGGLYNDPSNWENLLGGSGVPDSPGESARFSLDATYTVEFPADVTAAAASVIDGSVTWDLEDAASFSRVYSLGPLTVDGGGGGAAQLTIGGGPVLVESSLSVRNGSLTVSEPSGRLDSSAETVVVEDNGQIVILGDNSIDPTADPEFDVEGDLLIDGGTINIANSGSISFVGETMQTVTVQNGGEFFHDGGLLFGSNGNDTLTLTVDGVNSTFTQSFQSGHSFGVVVGHASNGSATINVQNGGSFATGSNLTISDQVRATGQLNVMSGGTFSSNTSELLVEGNVNLMDGVFNANAIRPEGGGDFNFLGGTLHVDGFDGNLLNQGGALAPGRSIGATSVSGGYTQQANAALQIEIGGVLPDQWDVLTVGGNAFVDGTLEVMLVDDFQPVLGNSFTIVSTLVGNVGGQFDTELMPIANGLTFNVVYNSKSIVLQVVPMLEADFDEDGDVDANDLTRWRTGFGASGAATHMQGDADGDFDVDGTDFLVWQRQLGSIASAPAVDRSAAAVPESTSLILGGLAAAVLVGRRRRRAF